MTALDMLAALSVATSVVVLVVRLWQIANTLEMGLPPAPPEDPPLTDPAVKPSDPFDALLVDLELFRITTMAPAPTDIDARLTPVPADAAVSGQDVVEGGAA